MMVSTLRVLPRFRALNARCLQNAFSTKIEGPEVPVNPMKDMFSKSEGMKNGYVYDKKPFRLHCEAGKVYAWCLCGRSKSQPLCDGTHKNIFWKITQKPIKFTVKETKDYWLCNCKQTSNRPFCDGTHLNEEIQEKKL